MLVSGFARDGEMMTHRVSVWAFAASLALAAAPGLAAQSNKWPERPVRVVVPFPPGGSTDIAARLVAPHFTEEFGQQFVVDNRSGAGGTIGAEIAARAKPDGYTIAVVASSYSSSSALYPLSFDPVKGIAPVGMIGSGPFILVVNPSVKASTLTEFIDLLRAKPNALNYGSQGTGSSPHLAIELFRQLTKTDMVHVPYKGDAPLLADLIGGQVQMMLGSGPVLLPHIRAGRLRALAVTSERRFPMMPELPPVADLLPGFSVSGWNGVWAPVGTPQVIINRLNQSLARILKLPDVQERLRADGREPTYTTPQEYARLLEREITTWKKVVKTANIRIN